MRYRRLYSLGGQYFLTLVLEDRKKFLLIENIKLLKSAFKTVKDKKPFKIDAIVVLPDHFHMIMTLPDNDTDYPQRISQIKSYFSRHLEKKETISKSRQHKRERGIWQRRFWEHYIRSEQDYEMHVNYIHYNPVKHGYVSRPNAWKYSSIHHYIRLGILPEDWAI